ncbi:hypothetical protein HN997_05515 [archaeon]|nr:hypothetical protein [archaeon]
MHKIELSGDEEGLLNEAAGAVYLAEASLLTSDDEVFESAEIVKYAGIIFRSGVNRTNLASIGKKVIEESKKFLPSDVNADNALGDPSWKDQGEKDAVENIIWVLKNNKEDGWGSFSLEELIEAKDAGEEFTERTILTLKDRGFLGYNGRSYYVTSMFMEIVGKYVD